MARGMKTRGVEEVHNLRTRARRQHNLGRISQPDCSWLVDKFDEIEAFIIGMEEKPDTDIDTGIDV